MYHEYFGLSQAPFKNTPDTRLFYSGGNRGEILDALVYAISSGEGIIKVVGEVGSGKTMLCRMLEVRLPENIEIVYLANPSLSPENILHAIALEMNLAIASDANRLQVMQALHQRLLEKHTANRQVVVFVEEAQSMPLETLEEIRLLSNLETQRDKLLQIVLFGQPELDKNLNASHIRQLKERITHSFYLSPLKRDDIRDYINFRLGAVGYRGPDVFSEPAYNRLARASEGLIRRINTLADKSLLAAFAQDTHSVTPKCVRSAVDDSTFERRARFGTTKFTFGAGGLVAVAALAWAAFGSMHVPWDGVEFFRPRSASSAALQDARVMGPKLAADLDLTRPVPGAMVGATAAADAAAETLTVADSMPQGLPHVNASNGGVSRADADELSVRRSDDSVVPVTTNSVSSVSAARDGRSDLEVSSFASTQTAEGARAVIEDAVAPAAVPPASAEQRPNSLLAERMDATHSWLDQVDGRRYSIQLLMTEVRERQFLEGFLAQWQQLGALDDLYVYKTVLRGKVWYGVLYREYATLTEAREGLATLPSEARRHHPFIRNIRDVAALG